MTSPENGERSEREGCLPERGWDDLSRASLVLEESLDYQTTLARIVQLAVPAVADFSAIALRDDDGLVTWAASAHRDPGKQILVERLLAYSPTPRRESHEAQRTPVIDRPEVVQGFDDAVFASIAQDSDHLDLLNELGPISFLSMPLRARGRVFGSLAFITTRESGRHYTDGDVATAREIARRAALAVDHAMLFKEAQHAVRLRDETLAMVSHDLRNPLGTIAMAAKHILDHIVPDDAAHAAERGYLRMITRATGHMRRLIGDLLDVSAVEAGRLTLDRMCLAPALLLDDARRMLEPLAAAKDIDLVGTIDDDLPAVFADRDRVLQVFGNIGGNAIKFTAPGGRVFLRAKRDAVGVEFEVRDSGVGIATADIPHVFDRFWQARDTARLGSGLGLAIAKGIVEAHGGRIEAHSVVAEGSSFRFTIPATVAGSEWEPVRSASRPTLEDALSPAS